MLRPKMNVRTRFLVSILPVLASCAATQQQQLVSSTGSGKVTHTVLFWGKKDTPADTWQQMSEALVDVAPRVQGLEALFAGPPAGTDRPVVDGSYSMLVTMRFANREFLEVWAHSPLHGELTARFQRWFERVVVYDTADAGG